MSHVVSIAGQEQQAERGACDGFSTPPSTPAAKRAYDVVLSALGLVLLSPLFLLIAALIKLSDGGPVFYRQRRIGLRGRPFFICKFRTMAPRADGTGPLVTADGDARVTKIGRILRKTKLDELPQLWNVLRGEMTLVGPRPEVPRYVERYTREQMNILDFKPGITDPASVHFRNEEMLLKNAEDVEEFYVRHCVPRKLQLNLEYAAKANLLSDTWIILQTICPYWICLLCVYSLVLTVSFWLSCQLIYGPTTPPELEQDFLGAMVAVVAVQLGALIWRQQCKGLLSYFSLPELRQVAAALTFACLLMLGLWVITDRGWRLRNLILVDSLVSLCALSGFRLLVRFWRETSSSWEGAFDSPPARVAIIGAGDTGSQVARELMAGKRFRRTVVAFFDDDSQKWQKRIHEVPIVGMPECVREGWAAKLDEVIVAMPNAPAKRIREVHRLVREAGLTIYRVPAAYGLWRGKGNGSGNSSSGEGEAKL